MMSVRYSDCTLVWVNHYDHAQASSDRPTLLSCPGRQGHICKLYRRKYGDAIETLRHNTYLETPQCSQNIKGIVSKVCKAHPERGHSGGVPPQQRPRT
ncbi:hypothetical protein AVEN_200673-1 [Araneus ventricosus]|uniref:Uncharacterized protein n=1 Tax=Araneus ventricosus TaxID=182803 RepID=A0A4Y2L9G5_ARAVE|nr:hypothetical protein AVEN_200673-1 [Araneus ventricosus]